MNFIRFFGFDKKLIVPLFVVSMGSYSAVSIAAISKMPLSSMSDVGEVATSSSVEFTIDDTTDSTKVLVWVLGPTLTDVGLNGLQDPKISVEKIDRSSSGDSTTLIGENDNWDVADLSTKSALATISNENLDVKESAILLELSPGDYQVVVESAVEGESGVASVRFLQMHGVGSGAYFDLDSNQLLIPSLEYSNNNYEAAFLLTDFDPESNIVSFTLDLNADFREAVSVNTEKDDSSDDESNDTDTNNDGTITPSGFNIDYADKSTWTRCVADDDLSVGPTYSPPECPQLTIVEPHKELFIPSCIDNPEQGIANCRFTKSSTGDEIYAVRLRISELEGIVSQLSINTKDANSVHRSIVWAVSDTPGSFDVGEDKRHCVINSPTGVSAVSVTTDEEFAVWMEACYVEPNKTHYLNLRWADYEYTSINSRGQEVAEVQLASKCGVGPGQHRCEMAVYSRGTWFDIGYDSIVVGANVLSVVEGQTVQIPVSLNGGIDEYSQVSYTVTHSSTQDADLASGTTAGLLAWTYGRERTQMITIPTLDDSDSEGPEVFIVNISGSNVYLSDGSAMGSGGFSTSVTIIDNDSAQ